MGLYPVTVRYNARQDNTIKYSTLYFNTLTHITQNNIQHSKQPSICKIKKKNT